LTGRGLAIDGDLAWRVIRHHAGIGAMLALLVNIATGAPRAVSRTLLTPDGRKLERKFLGPVGGGAMMLDREVTYGLHVAEGLESALAGRQLGLRPFWALGSAGAIGVFPVLNGVETISLLREHDDANRKAPDACAMRWHSAGRDVLDVWPNSGNDVNDAIRGARARD
jgi:putative DNA primase/helicase